MTVGEMLLRQIQWQISENSGWNFSSKRGHWKHKNVEYKNSDRTANWWYSLQTQKAGTLLDP